MTRASCRTYRQESKRPRELGRFEICFFCCGPEESASIEELHDRPKEAGKLDGNGGVRRSTILATAVTWIQSVAELQLAPRQFPLPKGRCGGVAPPHPLSSVSLLLPRIRAAFLPRITLTTGRAWLGWGVTCSGPRDPVSKGNVSGDSYFRPTVPGYPGSHKVPTALHRLCTDCRSGNVMRVPSLIRCRWLSKTSKVPLGPQQTRIPRPRTPMFRQERAAVGPRRRATPAGRGGQDAIGADLRVATVTIADSTAATRRAKPALRRGTCS